MSVPAGVNPLSPLSYLTADPKMLSFQTTVFEVLMESVLKMSNILDLKVFVLFEDVDKKRHFGGHEDLCAYYNDGILEAQKGDVELATGKTDLRVVHKSEGVRGRLYDHQMPPSTRGHSTAQSQVVSEVPYSQPSILPVTATQQQQQPYPPPVAQPDQQFLYQQLYQQLQSVLLKSAEANQQPKDSKPSGTTSTTDGVVQSTTLALTGPIAPSDAITPSVPHASSGPLVPISTASPEDEANDVKPMDDTAAETSMPAFADESGFKMSKRNILMADLEEADFEDDDAVSDCGSEPGVDRKREAGIGADEAGDAKRPKIDETYLTDPVLEQKIKKIEETIGLNIAKEYHDKTKHLLVSLRQPRQPNTPLTPANFDGRMQQIVQRHHASQIIVHPPVGSQRKDPEFQSPKMIYQSRGVSRVVNLAPKPAPEIAPRYPGPSASIEASPGPSAGPGPSPGPGPSSGPGYTTIIVSKPQGATIVANSKPRIIVTAASNVGRSRNSMPTTVVTPSLMSLPAAGSQTVANQVFIATPTGLIAQPNRFVTTTPDSTVGTISSITPTTLPINHINNETALALPSTAPISRLIEKPPQIVPGASIVPNTAKLEAAASTSTADVSLLTASLNSAANLINSESSKETSNQAELMMKLYKTLAEVVFGGDQKTGNETVEKPSAMQNGDLNSSINLNETPTAPSTLEPSDLSGYDDLMGNDVGSPASTASDGAGRGLGEGDNVCHVCQYRFRRPCHLRQHIQEVHEASRRFSCDICKRLFKRVEHLKKHLRTVHKDGDAGAAAIAATSAAATAVVAASSVPASGAAPEKDCIVLT